MKVGVICNPVICTDESEPLREALGSHEVAWRETTEEDPGGGQADELAEWGAEVVIVCGGDGTVRACAEALARSGIPTAIVPAGTGNLLVRNLELPVQLDDIVAAALDGGRMSIDLGRVADETFVVMAGAGLDATTMRETSSEAKSRLGVLSYIAEGARHLSDPPTVARITVDGTESANGSWITILVGKLGRLPGGVDLFPDSETSDGNLELVALAAGDLAATVAGGVSAITGTDHDQVLRGRGTEISVDFAQSTPYELDGDAREPVTRLRFSVGPHRLTLCTPKEDIIE